MFTIGDRIVYGSLGVCEITDIRTPDVSGATNLCYVLCPVYSETTKVYAPIETGTVILRELASRTEVDQLLSGMRNVAVLECKDKGEASKAYKNALRSADCTQWASLAKTLINKRAVLKGKNRPFNSEEKHYLAMAQGLLQGEVAEVLNIRYELAGEVVAQELVAG